MENIVVYIHLYLSIHLNQSNRILVNMHLSTRENLHFTQIGLNSSPSAKKKTTTPTLPQTRLITFPTTTKISERVPFIRQNFDSGTQLGTDHQR